MNLLRCLLPCLIVAQLGAQAPTQDLRPASERLRAEAFRTHGAYEDLAWLCDRIGPRLSGSPQLDQAIAWAQARLKAAGLANVHAEPVMVPHWVRGQESAELLLPNPTRLNILGLGGSVGTPEGGLTADVVVVGSFDELDKLGEAVKGKIVLFDVPFKGYGHTVVYRHDGAAKASKYGAAAALVRSVGPVSLDTPHTGAMDYDPAFPKIPTACVTIEASTQMRRMQQRGERIQMRLVMGAKTLPDAPSANVVAEIPGTEKPGEVVILSGHLDSWDVGQGAQDDGAGTVIAMEAARLIQSLGLKPRRTIRVVLWTNEENGLRGGRAYRDAHRAEFKDIVAAVETDSGSERIKAFSLELRKATPEAKAAALTALKTFEPALAPFGPVDLRLGGSGADVSPMVAEGVPGIGVSHAATHYFDIHHTHADTFDKVEKDDLAHNAAVLATFAFALAQSDRRFQ
ncbi:MAG: M20/M25/M40 family metallo-hydrolase [Geothrix sp.]|uniref:M20/M25/M40 family metallo-hydrolase n=1 Tax=Geothrix sp. TaxID=1962974 RepID=UPI0018491922|nr:M20/M25/M40 family metallo-hydrolase [Geothrix sp.]NWJ42249.1 M20/M25/M40 family metallo-hydrolase [Geothrix sp.]WIL19784.1 MAG: M20/M25/M40 family metallo-hydrolase [Geothrix sp.]